jgi:hypothetical protein
VHRARRWPLVVRKLVAVEATYRLCLDLKIKPEALLGRLASPAAKRHSQLEEYIVEIEFFVVGDEDSRLSSGHVLACTRYF